MSTDTPAPPDENTGNSKQAVSTEPDADIEPAAGASDQDTGANRYVQIASTDEFNQLRRALRRFVFPVSIAFLVWYALYVLLSAYARGFMSHKIVGEINVALVFGLLQFVTTFVIAWLYARYADRNLDPLADRLRDRIENGGGS